MGKWNAVLCVAVSIGWTSASPAGDRAAVPAAAAQSATVKDVRKLFAADYAKRDAKSQAALAGKLLKNAEETGDANVRYALLAEARDVAAGVGDAKAALAAARRLDELYDDKPAAATVAAITALRRAPMSPAAGGDVAIASLEAIDLALAGEDFTAAGKLATAAVEAASRASDPELASTARERAADVRAATGESGRVASDRKTLAANLTDPKACTAVGRFDCFTLGRWDRGLPLLLHAQDEKLRQLAALEGSASTDPSAALKAADGWFALAQTSRGLARAHLVQRAMSGYRAALPRLAGVERLRAEEQTAAILRAAKPWDPFVVELKADEHGVDLGMTDRDVGNAALIQMEVRTTWTREGFLLTKRHAEQDSSITLKMRPDGGVTLSGEGSFYLVEVKGASRVNDGRWHTVRVEKQGLLARLFVDGKPEGTLETRLEFKSKSPWMTGWHGAFNRGAMDGEVRHVRIESAG